ncbi:MAG: LAGLIDADG family homing endonuclease [bacterium]|nr:LAGLIDADG family homing endonuclease [bacterium]
MTTLSKTQLADLYSVKKLSTWEIEKQYGYSRSRVYSSLKRYGIPVRSLAASHVKTQRVDFNGTLLEKAYLFGFAVGDLRVRLHNKKGGSETISIACSSNKPAQISLINELFISFGHIWRGKPNQREVVSIEAFVNLSFSFLLGKDWKSFAKSIKTRKQFLAFLAGFSDAEGSIFISRGMAQMSWGNYDRALLLFFKKGLANLGVITGTVTSDHLQGYRGRDGYVRSRDYYHLSCARKASLEKLLNMLVFFSRHDDKRCALVRALANITERNQKYGKR